MVGPGTEKFDLHLGNDGMLFKHPNFALIPQLASLQ